MRWLTTYAISASRYRHIACREIIARALNDFDAHLQALIQTYLTNSDKLLLDNLVENSSPTDLNGIWQRYPLTELKQISQAMNPKSIAERVASFNRLKVLFTALAPLITHLDLTDDTIQYYAQYVLDNLGVRLAERVHERYGCGRPSQAVGIYHLPVPECGGML